ncbi:hypothetical protein KM043_007864 [Ampulex compressa]|nr:hypothetical protein KM043_007864 [Ampulex compressa]
MRPFKEPAGALSVTDVAYSKRSRLMGTIREQSDRLSILRNSICYPIGLVIFLALAVSRGQRGALAADYKLMASARVTPWKATPRMTLNALHSRARKN